MESSTVKRLTLVCFLAIFIFSAATVKAAPKIRASKGQVEANGVRNTNNQMSCYETIPCGWALYSTERRQPFRRISTYTRNRLCTCDSTHRCVLTDNWQDRRAYVFQCRNRESSNHMFPFPDRK